MKATKIVKMLAPFYSGFDMARWHNLMRRFKLNESMKLADYSKGMQMKFSIAMAFQLLLIQMLFLMLYSTGMDYITTSVKLS